MGNRWPGGLIRKNQIIPAGPGQTGAAPGMWTLAEAAYWTKQNLWPLAGVSPDPNWSSVSYLMSTTATNGGQNNTFVDSSTNNFSFIRYGNPTQGSFTPFQTPPVGYPGYSTSSFGGSGYFDGTGDGLTVANNSAFALGSGNFTLECWVYNSEVVANCGYAGVWANSYILYREGTSYKFYYNGPSGSPLTSSIAAVANTWTHLAVVRNGSTLTLYVNGVSGASANISTTAFSGIGSGVFGIGANFQNPTSPAFPFTGYMASLRLVTGTAVYTSAFTPPTTPLTAISGTAFLCNFTNANSFDAAMRCDLETAGNAQVSTAQAKFGTTSMAFDGSGDYLRVNTYDPSLFAFGTGDFTIEFWLRINTTAGLQFMYEGRGGSDTPTIYMNGAALTYYTNGINAITGANLSTGVWYHVALARSGTSTKMFLDGTQTGSTYTDSTNYTNIAGRPVFGIESGLSLHSLNGYLDEMRVTKGVARYTANFTAPTAAFPLF